MTESAWVAEVAWKGTVILAVAFSGALMLRRGSAAARHLLWTAAFGALFLLPLATAVLPAFWSIQPEMAGTAGVETAMVPTVSAAAPAGQDPGGRIFVPWLLLWAAGCVLSAGKFAMGAARTRAVLRKAEPAGYAQALADTLRSALRMRGLVKVLEAPDAPVPLACGVVRPAVVLPRGAARWPEARLRTVLHHELAHVRRGDLAAQMLAQAACCLYWFHPLAWLAASQMRRERERACDDVVLASGTAAHEYAADLLEVARGLAARRRVSPGALAMATRCDLESRVRALLDSRTNRRPLGFHAATSAGTAAIGLVFALAAFSLHAQNARGALAGVVQDPSGARVPGCRVTAKPEAGQNEEVTKTNAAGEYRFLSIPAGKYTVQFTAAGFAPTKRNAAIAAGETARADATLDIGRTADYLTVRGEKPLAPARSTGIPERIRVGGNVKPGRALQQPAPVYPADLQQQGIEGTVVIRAVVSVDGSVLSPQVVNTDIDPRLAQLALDAVKQWRYEPALLNGQPVETATTLMIDFTLESRGIKSAR